MEVKIKEELDECWPQTHRVEFKEEKEFLVDNVSVADCKALMLKEEELWPIHNFDITYCKKGHFYCYHCGSMFSKLRILRSHIKHSHLNIKTNEDLRSHIICLLKNPNSLYEYVDPPCIKKTKQKKYKNYQCLLCDFRTCYPSNLRRHRLGHHTINKPHQCFLCDYNTGYSELLKIHVMRHHSDYRPYQCQLCDFTTVEVRNLKRHLRNKHGNKNTKEKSHQCLLCKYKSEHVYDVNRHMCLKHSEKMHQCNLCKYKTNYPINLQRHIKACHTDDRPYQCSWCHYKTAISSHLRRHMKGKKHRVLVSSTN